MKEEQKHKQKAGGRRRKYRKKPKQHPPCTTTHLPLRLHQQHLHEATAERKEHSWQEERKTKEVDSTVEQRRKRGETMASLQWGRRRKTVAPPGFSATTTPGWRDTNATTVNDSTSIPGNTLLFLLVCPVDLLHAERALLTFLQQGR